MCDLLANRLKHNCSTKERMGRPTSIKMGLTFNDLYPVADNDQFLIGVFFARSCVLFIVVSADRFI